MSNINLMQDNLIEEIKLVLTNARKTVAKEINAQLLMAYWQVGELIVRYEQDNQIRAEYGKQTLKEISKKLTTQIGKGFSVSNLQFMRRFYQKYQI